MIIWKDKVVLLLYKGGTMMENMLEKVKWISPEEDLEKLFRSEDYEKVIQLSEENKELLFDLYQENQKDCLHTSIRFGKFLLKYFKRQFCNELRSTAILSAGILMGYIELLDRIRFREEQNCRVLDNARYSGTKHLDEIVFALETHGNVSQKELSEILELQASTLSEILKKVRKTGFVRVAPYGKYKMYSLTDEGIRYGALLRKRKSEEPEYLQAIETISKYIENDNTKDECIKQLKKILNDGNRKLIAKNDEFNIYDINEGRYETREVISILQKQTNSQKEPEDFILTKKIATNYYNDNELNKQTA